MASQLEMVLAEALRGIVDYVESHDATFNGDDDVRALEDVARALQQVAPHDRSELIDLLGPKISFEMGLSDADPKA